MKVKLSKYMKFSILVIFALLTSASNAETHIDSLGIISLEPISIKITILDDLTIEGSYTLSRSQPLVDIPITGLIDGTEIFLQGIDEALEEKFEGNVTYHRNQILLIEGSFSSKRDFNFNRNTISLRPLSRPFSFFGEFNLLSDNFISCQEIEMFPEIVFNSRIIDLGSGSTARDTIESSCPKNIDSIEFMVTILELTNEIRGNECRGTIWGALTRNFYFNLSKMGYLPMVDYVPTRIPELNLDVFNNFLQNWSTENPENLALFNDFIFERGRIFPLLVNWYEINYGISSEEAQTATSAVLYEITRRAYERSCPA